jgi:L-2-hydroxyglutarate oxidase LhgO
MSEQRFGVVGAGILGLAVARRLTQVYPGCQVTVLEKEDGVARHQTGHNSGVAHAGLYYEPGSLKALLCRRGVGLLRDFCAEHGVAFVECGKLVVATAASELPALARIEDRATANGVPGLRRVGSGEIREIEPHVSGVAALHSPSSAIVDYVAVSAALGQQVVAAGGALRFGWRVCAVDVDGERVTVRSAHGDDERFDRLVVCAGLQSDRVARLAGDGVSPAIVPFRGEYYRLVPQREDLVKGLVYPVPDPRYPFLGVHLTRRVDGGVDIGPNAVLALAREGYRWRDVDPGDVWAALRFPGTRRLAARHWRAGARELRGSLSRRAFVREAARYLPELTVDDVVRSPAGVRAQAVDRDGSLVDDFRIGRIGPVVTVRNAPSPGATSSLAIAEHLVERFLGAA